jgi:phage gp45-like
MKINKICIVVVAFLMLPLASVKASEPDTLYLPNYDFEGWSQIQTSGNLILKSGTYPYPTSWTVLTFNYDGSPVPINYFEKATGTNAVGGSGTTAVMHTFGMTHSITTLAWLLGGSVLSNYGLTQSMKFPTVVTTATTVNKTWLVNTGGLIGCKNTSQTMEAFITQLSEAGVNGNLGGGTALNGFKATRLHGTYKYSNASSNDRPIFLMLGVKQINGTWTIVGKGYDVNLNSSSYTDFDIQYTKLREEDADKMMVWISSSNFSVCKENATLYLDNVVLIHDPCDAPENLAVADITATSGNVSWDQNGQSQWQLVYSPTALANPATGTINELTTNSYSLTGLTSNQEYHVYVRSVCGAYYYSDWSEITFTPQLCEEVSGVTVSNINSTSAQVDWTPAAGQTSWQVVYGAAGVNANTATPVTVTAHPYTIEELTPGTDYDVYVRAHCGETMNSEWTPVTHFSTPCDGVTGVAISNVTYNSANVSWTAGAGQTQWEVVVVPHGNAVGSGTPQLTTNNPYTATGLNEHTQYDAYVRAVCSETNKSDWSSVVDFETEYAPCEAVTNLVVTGQSTSGATVSWTPATGQTSWTVGVVPEGGNIGDAVYQTVNTPTYTFTGLAEGTVYNVMVVANCPGGRISDPLAGQFTTVWPHCPEVTAITVANITVNTADISWESGDRHASWEVVVVPQGNAPTTGTPTVVTTNSYTATGLAEYTTYDVYIRATCTYDSVSNWSSPEGFTTAMYPCNDVTLYTITGITVTNATASWSNPGYQTSWDVVIVPTGNAPATGTPITGVTATTYTFTGLEENTTYDVYVRGNCSHGRQTDWSNVQTFTTSLTDCDAMTGVDVSNITVNGATVSWTSPANITSWEVVVVPTGAAVTTGTPEATTSNPYTLTGLDENTTYDVYVRGNCTFGRQTDWSAVETFTTSLTDCDAMTGVTVSNIIINGATVSWTSPANITSWEIVVVPTGDAVTTGTPVPTTSNPYTITGLDENTTYDVYVRGDCTFGRHSDWTMETFTTTLTDCDAMTGVAVSNITVNGATVSWTSPANITSWEVVVVPTGAAVTTGTPEATTSNPYTLTGLDEHTTYDVYVRGDCTFGRHSDWSTVQSFTTEYTDCDAMTGVTVSNITVTGATVSWTSPANITSWEVVVVPTGGAVTTGTPVPTTQNPYTITGLDEHATYDVYVRGDCTFGRHSDWSTVESFTTEYTDCNAMTNVTVTGITVTDATVSWASPMNISSWQIVVVPTGSDVNSGTPVTTSDNPYTVTGLAEHTTYDVYVRGNCTFDRHGDWSTVETFTTEYTDCDPMTGVAVNDIHVNDATVSWTSPANITSWQVVVVVQGGDPNAVTPVAATSPYTITGLAENTEYDVYVRGNCTLGRYSEWTSQTFTTAMEGCDPETNVAASNITITGATITWDAPANQSSWEVVIVEAGQPATAGTPEAVTATTYTVDNLSEGTEYTAYVRGDCTFGRQTPWSSVDFETEMQPCETATALQVSNITVTGATVSWTSPANITSWQIVVVEAGGDPDATTPVTTDQNPYTITGLSEHTDYDVYVRSNCTFGRHSDWSDEASFTTEYTECEPVENVSVSGIGTSSVVVSWTSPANESSWQIAVVPQGGNPDGVTSIDATTNPYTVTGLEEGTTYDIYVRGNCTFGRHTVWSDSETITTEWSPCLAVTNVAISNIDHQSAVISWTPQASHIAWDVVVVPQGGDPDAATPVRVTSTSYTATGLEEHTAYDVYVRGICTPDRPSDWSAVVGFTTEWSPCVTVSNVMVSNITYQSAVISWTPAAGQTTWEVVVVPQGGNPNTASAYRVTEATYTATGLAEGTTYDVYVRAICYPERIGDWSARTQFITYYAPCESVSNINITNITTTSATVTWSAPAGQSSWQVVVVTAGTSVNNGTPVAVNSTNYTITGLTPGTSYDVYIRAVCGPDRNSEWSFANNFVTALPPCETVVNLRTTIVDETTATVIWSHYGTALRYEVVYGQPGFNPDYSTARTTTNMAIELTGLTPFTTYEVYVRAICAEDNYSAWSSVLTFTTLEHIEYDCEPVRNVQCTVNGSNVVITWTPGADQWLWQVNYGLGGYTRDYVYPVTVDHAYYAVYNMEPGTYDVYVRSVCGEDFFSDYSSVVSFTIENPNGIDDVEQLDFVCYPNPNSGSFMISMSNAEEAAVKVYDITGRVVLSRQHYTSNEPLSIATSGMYFVEVTTSTSRLIKSITVTK